MNFHMTFKNDSDGRFYARILLKLKLTLIILVTVILQSRAVSFAQITINEKSASLESILQKIRKQGGYYLFYSNAMLKNTKPVSINVKNASVEDVLKISFLNQPLTYIIEKKAVVLRYIKTTENSHAEQKTITGKIADDQGPVVGASVRIKGIAASPMAVSDGKGYFTIAATEDQTLVISYIGYETQEVVLKGRKLPLTIFLKTAETEMKNVVINGMQTVRKDILSGASAQFSGAQLKAIGNSNIIQSLKTLDPSFIQIENNIMGSNPNVLPTIELRGQTSITTSGLRDQFSTDPNQPLFILDGFETSLRNIVDLDMNTVASISILKDASSTAVYGSRASNGVIVVETKKPVPGKLRINYTMDSRFELPDLSSYNMMNATEKLEFERLAGRYKQRSGIEDVQLVLDTLYNKRLKEVLRGVNTYWLNKPLQTGFSHRHSLSASGGDETFRYDVGVNYKTNDATMIGSKRNDWGTNIGLNYRSGIFNINNRVYISGGDNADSPYGEFSDWAKINPYYRFLPASEKYLDIAISASPQATGLSKDGTERIPNPYYNAALLSFAKGKNFNITNNLQFIAQVNTAFRISANLQLSKSTDETQDFVSPLNTKFDNVSDPLLKGTYELERTNGFGYTANLNLNYNKLIAQKHSFGAMVRTEFSESKRDANGYTAMGFPGTSNGNPAFAYGFLTDSHPSAANSTSRRHSIIGSLNYSYDYRYNIDMNASIDGTTSFGSNKRYKPYYAIGASWNLHNEAFLKESKDVNSLRLRANIGLTGNQNFGSVSESVYNYYSSISSFGQGVFLSELGAPYLEQQQTLQISLGLDGVFFNNRLDIQLNAYQKTTDPQVVAITLPSSTGLSNYPFNAGASTVKGVELISRVTAIRKENGLRWDIGLTSSLYNQKFSKFNNQLDGLNSILRESKSLTRYRDGYSSYDIWAVPSLGIDPGTGREIFLKKDGTHTFVYDENDIVVAGSSKPTVEGVISTNVYYKGFTAGAYFRYLVGRSNLNSALYEKVENISLEALRYNQDKRALDGRWKKAGDQTQFKGISITESTPISSRFIQEENTITGESLSLGYEFRNKTWLDKASLSAISITGYTNDLFYASTVLRERGTSYPFARSFSLSLKATFK
ncbi:SusC/RagA family TonB-linked outer membrane protein [Pedobacter nyackensis]|uniref:SusC/RagA family TonB-linked outer membrane protein n=1 Tax=Pedobacter nyackensis TaxID=475255 RepID=UPI00292EDE5A|nr:SusC/RagA family TonB-linked outer membrane protein [Pedobacter nyackensis]